MSIRNFMLKIKQFRYISRDMFAVLLIVMVGLAGFGLGRLSVQYEHAHTGISVYMPTAVVSTGQTGSPVNDTDLVAANETYVASVNGTKYHFPWCSGAGRIKEENKRVFHSRAEAQEAGYTPAANCKGL